MGGEAGWPALGMLIIMFYDFNGKYDLYDAIMHWLMK